jgi:hypothetical protein
MLKRKIDKEKSDASSEVSVKKSKVNIDTEPEPNIFPEEIFFEILDKLDRESLCTASLVSRQFNNCANSIFKNRLQSKFLLHGGAKLNDPSYKKNYFDYRQKLNDAVNRVLCLLLPRYLTEEKDYFLDPSHHHLDFDNGYIEELTTSLKRQIRNFNVASIVKKLIKRKKERCYKMGAGCEAYKDALKKEEFSLLHRFIGTMNLEAVRLLIEKIIKKGKDINEEDAFGANPINILFRLIGHFRGIENGSYPFKKPKKPPFGLWPSYELIELLIAQGADFNHKAYYTRAAPEGKTIVDALDLDDYPLEEAEVEGIRIFALLYAKGVLSVYPEENFKKLLPPTTLKIYEEEKAKIIEKIIEIEQIQQQETERSSLAFSI